MSPIKESVVIDSLDDPRAWVRAILKELNTDPALALGAAANPLVALEELGFKINPKARQDITERIRFPLDKIKRLQDLREAVFGQTGARSILTRPRRTRAGQPR